MENANDLGHRDFRFRNLEITDERPVTKETPVMTWDSATWK
jgi:hypothetical protein